MIMVVDVERFGDRRRTNPHQVIVRDALYEVVQLAFAEAGIEWAACRNEDRGDGVLVLAPAEIPKTPFVDRVPGALAAGLRQHNQCHRVEEQIRLRLALHAGEVQFDGHGVTSAAVNHTFRLLDARPLKTALADSPSVLALITSSWFFEDVVRHSQTVDPATFRPVRVVEKETSTIAWIALPDKPYPPDPAALIVPSPEPVASPVPYQVPATLGSTAMFSMRGDIPDFVGRHAELRALLDAVTATADGPVRGIAVHTVNGMPGVGKTTFSVHAAHHLADRFPDGRIFLELYGHSSTQAPRDPADALASLLVATGMDPRALPKEVDDRARLWRDRIAGNKVLLVLDDAASHDQLRPLLPGTPDCFVLITSRHRLPALDGVHALALDVLPPDQAARLLLTLAHRDPTSPDADSATAAQAEARTGAETGAVALVVELCGFLPLAIALAAGRLRSHPTWSAAYLADLLAEDPDRLEHLAAGDRSIRAAFTVSYQHLTAERQRILTLLGVHPGPSIDAYALAALANCSLTQAHQHLDALHADHLVQETTPGRYQLHDLLRVYASSLAATADQADAGRAMRRVLDYYLYTAATAAVHIPAHFTPTLTITPLAPAHHPMLDTPQRARAWLGTELATLAACVEHGAAHPDLVIALVATLQNYLRLSGAWEQAHDIHQTALAAVERTPERIGQATILTGLGVVYRLWGDSGRAEQVFDQAHHLFTDLGDRRGQATTLTELGIVYRLRGDSGRAQQVLDQAHHLFTDLGDRHGQATTLTNLGQMYHHRGDLGRARQVLDQAHHLFTDLGDRHGQATTLTNLGIVYYYRGDLGRARQVLDQAHHLFTDLGDRHGQANTLLRLGQVYLARGDFEGAQQALNQARRFYTHLGDRLGQATTLYRVGQVYLARGDFEGAQQALDQAHHLLIDLGTPHGQANTLLNLGRVHYQKGDYDQALDLLTRAHALFTDVGDLDGQAETLNSLGDLALDHRPAGDPHALFTQAHSLACTIGSAMNEAHGLVGLGRCAHLARDVPTATTAFTQALTIYQRLGSPEAATITGYLADLYRNTDQQPETP